MNNRNKDSNKSQASQLLNVPRDSYLDRTARPIYALTYLLGFIVLYEVGTILVSPQVLAESLANVRIRVASFVWVQNFLEYIGFTSDVTWFATPLVLIVILFALQITSHSSWRVSFKDFLPMTLECVVLSIPLLVLGMLINSTPSAQAALFNAADQSSAVVPGSAFWTEIVTGIGAGIYEELVFRLILISLITMCLNDFLGVERKWAVVISVVLSAALFSAHHHIFYVDGSFKLVNVFTRSEFIFRFLAGGYFAAVFAVRGFGIVAGTHAFYDIIAAILNALVFGQNP